jgi:hypothetical protein
MDGSRPLDCKTAQLWHSDAVRGHPPHQARLADGRDGGQAQARQPPLALPPAQADVEPVIGQIKHARGFGQFLVRGFSKVQDE